MNEADIQIEIPKLNRFYQVLDRTLEPIMWVLGGMNGDSLQEHHRWHILDIDPDLVDRNLAVEVTGSLREKDFDPRFDIRFHMPIIGGWKEYAVLGMNESDYDGRIWHIGWSVMGSGKLFYCQLNKKPIADHAVKVLKGTGSFETIHFAFDSSGRQLPLAFLDEGSHGDKKHSNLRLF